VSSARNERLVNLVLCLLATRQYLGAERIRNTVAGYNEAPTDEAFFRMFERDKAELRELGVPVETGRNSHFDNAEGYRIARRDYELPDIDLAPDEAAALALAARLWDSPQLATSAHNAVLKLRAAGVEVDRVVTFSHRRSPVAEPTARTVQPWGVVSFRGRWYLVGHDQQRRAVRCFRLSRIAEARATGAAGVVTIPEGSDLLALVTASAGPPTAPVDATILLAPGRALGLRRGARVLESRPDGDLVQVHLPAMDVAVRWIAGYGGDAVVIEPLELRERVLQTLAGALA